MRIYGTDKLSKVSIAEDTNRIFAYDVTRPTLTVTSGPGQLLPLGPRAAVWRGRAAARWKII